MSADPAITAALLAELAAAPEGMSLPRLCKRLGLRMSVLLRSLAWLGKAEIGGIPGPGWIVVEAAGGRDVARLTAAGRVEADARKSENAADR